MKNWNINNHIITISLSIVFGYMLSLGYYDEGLPTFLKYFIKIFMIPLLTIEGTFFVLELSKDIFDSFPLVFIVNALTLLLMVYSTCIIVMNCKRKKKAKSFKN